MGQIKIVKNLSLKFSLQEIPLMVLLSSACDALLGGGFCIGGDG